MPKDNIDRAIKKATGGDAESYDEIRYEGYGPGGVAVIVEVLTDNRNRTAGEVRATFAKSGGNLAETGAVSFMLVPALAGLRVAEYAPNLVKKTIVGAGHSEKGQIRMPAQDRPPVLMMALHIWALSHGIASLFGRGDAARRALPMSPEDLLEAAVLIYLRGLGLTVPADGAASAGPWGRA